MVEIEKKDLLRRIEFMRGFLQLNYESGIKWVNNHRVCLDRSTFLEYRINDCLNAVRTVLLKDVSPLDYRCEDRKTKGDSRGDIVAIR
jgi:hypothetical protein